MWHARQLTTSMALVARSVPSSRRGRAFCVAGVALGDMLLYFAWQAWHFETSTFVSQQAWHVWHWPGSGGALGSQQSPWPRLFAWQARHLATCSCTLRGRRGILWQAWHFEISTFVSRGRRGTYGTGAVAVDAAAFCVAGVAL